ncbi:MAG: hypothetical protein SWX82_01460 [Cyanobacteriota bacterium]|nr:hypothetical protein [Cyanobacteriota bacterium]
MNETNLIEVNGIRFETIVPKRVLTLPKKDLVQKLSDIGKHLLTPSLHPSPGYPVEIGIRITNNSDRSLYFSFYLALGIEIIQVENGKNIPFQGGWFHPEQPLESDFSLTMPGESTSFFLDTKICWLCGNNYGISMGFNGGAFIFKPLISGRYKLRLIYHNQTDKNGFYDSVNKQTKVIERLWTGRVLTPFVEIHLVR